ncbi:hypothetical protein BSU04_09015 [Caballeronia sordidicola]|uniref:Uncharacterized protein n=1 Tax=Caballeronia sordidicola TaxID=196367 RepID=A0A226X6T2_CABSO|nr:hypothetical protein BSU04_09015 [Caballeronia sordidicola]
MHLIKRILDIDDNPARGDMVDIELQTLDMNVWRYTPRP